MEEKAEDAEEGRDGESSNNKLSQPVSTHSQAGPPCSSERQSEDESDKKPPAAPWVEVAAVGLNTEDRRGFAYAVENVKPEDLPEFVKQHDNTLSFPEKLNAKEGKSGKSAVVGWTDDETAFVIRNKEELTSKWLPRFFAQAKYSSFTRKLYRWGFRKINVTPGDDKKSSEVIFGNLNFRRNQHYLMANMRSITAAKSRGETDKERKQGGPSSNVLLPQGTGSLVDPGLSPNLALFAQLQQLQVGPYLRPAAAPTAIDQNTSLLNAWRNAALNSTMTQGSIPQQLNSSLGSNRQPQDNTAILPLLALSQLQGPLRTPLPSQQQLQLSSMLTALQPSQQSILLRLGMNLQQQQQQQQQDIQRLHQQGQPPSEEERQRLAQIAETFLRFRSFPPPT